MFAYACCVREGVVSPSASSILGMSRNFSATSKAVFRLPMGSSYRETRYWRVTGIRERPRLFLSQTLRPEIIIGEM